MTNEHNRNIYDKLTPLGQPTGRTPASCNALRSHCRDTLGSGGRRATFAARFRRAALLSGLGTAAMLAMAFNLYFPSSHGLAAQEEEARSTPKGAHSTAASGPLSPRDWKADIAFLMEQLRETHPDLYRTNDREAWERAESELLSRLSQMDTGQVILAIQKLMAMADDGHTGVRGIPGSLIRLSRWLPVELMKLADGWMIRRAHEDYAQHLGKRVLRIENTSIDDVFGKVRPFIAADNDYYAYDVAARSFMRLPDVLHEVGVVGPNVSAVTMTVADSTGRESRVTISIGGGPFPTPAWREAKEKGRGWLARFRNQPRAFEYLDEEGILYIWYGAVRDGPDESVAAFFDRMFSLADARPVKKFVLDLRGNGGGNNYLNQTVVRGLIQRRDLDVPGKLFVIIGRHTFSAAVCLAAALERNTNAIFVGGPTGAGPNHFGDAREFTLPRSGILCRCSTLYWQNSDPRDDRRWISPDVPAEQSIADYLAGLDPAYDAIRGIDPDSNLTRNLGPPNRRWMRDGR